MGIDRHAPFEGERCDAAGMVRMAMRQNDGGGFADLTKSRPCRRFYDLGGTDYSRIDKHPLAIAASRNSSKIDVDNRQLLIRNVVNDFADTISPGSVL